jgi:hypothetical protein
LGTRDNFGFVRHTGSIEAVSQPLQIALAALPQARKACSRLHVASMVQSIKKDNVFNPSLEFLLRRVVVCLLCTSLCGFHAIEEPGAIEAALSGQKRGARYGGAFSPLQALALHLTGLCLGPGCRDDGRLLTPLRAEGLCPQHSASAPCLPSWKIPSVPQVLFSMRLRMMRSYTCNREVEEAEGGSLELGRGPRRKQDGCTSFSSPLRSGPGLVGLGKDGPPGASCVVS